MGSLCVLLRQVVTKMSQIIVEGINFKVGPSCCCFRL